MPNQQSLSPIVFSDFRPGIADNPGMAYPPEQAERTNTYRCITNRAGALVPLPSQDASFPGIDYETGNPDAGFYVINGFYVPPYFVVPETASDPQDPDGRLHPVFLAVSYTKSTNFQWKLTLFRMWDNPRTSVLVDSASTAAAGNTGATGIGTTFGMTRMHQADPTTPGIPVVAYGWGSNIPALGIVGIFPDDTAPTADGVYHITTAVLPNIVAVHQGRVVISEVSGYGFGAQGVGANSENLFWTDVNDPTVLSAVQSFVPENPNGYSVMYTMSANELFCLKENGAAVLIGDLDFPTVTNLPMVPGSSIVQTPTPTLMGLIYGSPDSGVWAWQHGDSSTLLSPQMNPDFWVVPGTAYLLGNRAQFATWDDWIIAPNNWVFDTPTKSWWRLEDETVMQITKFSRWRNFLYGALQTYTHTALTAFYSWNRNVGAKSFSWQSHPIWNSIPNAVTIEDIELIAQGAGTVTLTLSGIDGTTKSKVITLANTGYPERFRERLYIQGRFMKLRIESSSDTSSAPQVWNVTLHPELRSPIAHT